MKKSIAGILGLVMMGVTMTFATGCKHNDDYDNDSRSAHQYSCSMHPEVAQSSPGNCPKCGMKLQHRN